MLKSLQRISFGFSLALRGLAGAWQQKELRRVYRLYVFGLSGLSLALFLGGLWSLFSCLDPTMQSDFWLALGSWLLFILGLFSLLLLSPILAFFIGNLVLPFYNEQLLFSGLGLQRPARTAWLRKQEGLPLWRSALNSLRRLFIFGLLLTSSFLLSLIPGVGAPVAFILQVSFSAPLITQELLEPYFEKLNFDYQAQVKATKAYREEVLGFGLASLLLLAIPLIGPLFIGLLQVATSELIVELYEDQVIGTGDEKS